MSYPSHSIKILDPINWPDTYTKASMMEDYSLQKSSTFKVHVLNCRTLRIWSRTKWTTGQYTHPLFVDGYLTYPISDVSLQVSVEFSEPFPIFRQVPTYQGQWNSRGKLIGRPTQRSVFYHYSRRLRRPDLKRVRIEFPKCLCRCSRWLKCSGFCQRPHQTELNHLRFRSL